MTLVLYFVLGTLFFESIFKVPSSEYEVRF